MGNECDRKEGSTHSATWSDFGTFDQPELLLLCALPIVFVGIYASLPKLLSQIYGSEATLLYRPTNLILLIGFLLSLNPAKGVRRDSFAPLVLLGITSATWATFMKYGTEYFRYDVAVITSVIHFVNRCHAYAPQFTRKGSSFEISDQWSAILGSSLVEVCFEGPLMLSLILLLRQRVTKSHLSAILCAGVLLGWGLLWLSIIELLSMAKTSTIFVLIVVLNVVAVLIARNYRHVPLCVMFTMFSIWCLWGTTTYSCSTLPYILGCRLGVGDFITRASAESTTGQILVLENDKYRLLLADHSLLGGQWRGYGNGQSIFSTFYMQSLAIYAFHPPRADLDVLQIGLGIGTSTKMMLMLHNTNNRHIQVDVVELDPKVLEYAHDFFELPRPSDEPRLRTYAVDALRFVETARNRRYDLISHDIFTGGSLAYPLFTLQFFQQLKSKLNDGGILVVNYVYSPSLAQKSFEAVTNTLRSTFSKVVVYLESGKLNEINNLVFLCSDADIELNIPDTEWETLSNFGQTAKHMKEWQYHGLSGILYNASQILQDEAYDDGASRASIRASDVSMSLQHWSFMRDLLPIPENEIWISY